MTSLEGSTQICFQREIQDRHPKSFYWYEILNLKWQIDSLLPKGPVIVSLYTIMLRRHSKQEKG